MKQQQDDQKKILKDKNNNIQYIRGKLLGTGGFAKCFEVINQDNQQIYAAKVIPKKTINQKRQRYKLLVQIKIHRSLKHKHIVQFIQTFEDKQNVYILLQYCHNYTLKDLVKRRKRITQYQTKIYIEQIVKALQYIHSQSIIHRDLKLGNILINDHMDTKICDFGLSTRVKNQGEVKKTICGTPNYIAPEILEENGHSYQVDIWSIGVIMYTLLFGKPPFQDTTVQQTYQNIKTNRFSYPPCVPISNPAKDLINKILVTNPSKRIGLQQILQHPFMKNNHQLPKQLPNYTIAIPPIKILQIESRQLSQHDTNMQISAYIQQVGSSNNNKQSYQHSPQKYQLGISIKSEYQNNSNGGTGNKNIPGLYIRQCFYYEGMLGYLISNGSIGYFIKNTGTNYVLQYGSQNYYTAVRCTKLLKKPYPLQQLQKNYQICQQHILHLHNFRKFFITKYSIFKLDQLHKKYQTSLLLPPKLASPNNKTKQRNSNRYRQQDQPTYIKKLILLQKGQILTRLSNNIVQLHFNDLSCLMINYEDNGGIYYMNDKGKIMQINYNQCFDKIIKTKIRMFSNLLQKLYNYGPINK